MDKHWIFTGFPLPSANLEKLTANHSNGLLYDLQELQLRHDFSSKKVPMMAIQPTKIWGIQPIPLEFVSGIWGKRQASQRHLLLKLDEIDHF